MDGGLPSCPDCTTRFGRCISLLLDGRAALALSIPRGRGSLLNSTHDPPLGWNEMR